MSTQTQHYIGIANGVVLCVDTVDHDTITGRYYHGYQQDASRFYGISEILFQLEELFDKLRFPFAGTNNRSFLYRNTSYAFEERNRVMSDEELLEKHGELGTFIIRVQHRQNSSWQGRITWVEEDKTVNFRSVFEMMKLIDGAMEQYKTEEDKKGPSWDD